MSDITARTGRDTSTAYIESSIDLEEGLKTLTAIINKYGEGSLVIDNYEPIDDLNDRVRDIIESTVVPPYDTEIEKFDSRSGSHIRISAIGGRIIRPLFT